MPNTLLSKSLHLCFSIIKRPQPQPPHDQHSSQPTTTTTTTTTTATLVANYNSLYDSSAYYSAPSSPPTSECGEATYRVWGFDKPVKLNRVHDPKLEHDNEAGPAPATVPDMTAVYASGRFFISCPGRSNSILATEEEVAGGVPVRTYSPDPYGDFRRSMEEMVVARDLDAVEKEEAWEYLQELLLSYLALNPKSTHKYIIGAFADLLISLLSSSSTSSTISSYSSDPL